MSPFIQHGSDLFNYDQRVHSSLLLPPNSNVGSTVEYDEYVVYKVSEEDQDAATASAAASATANGTEPVSPGGGRHADGHVSHRYSQDHRAGAVMLDLSCRQGHMLDRNGRFCIPHEPDPSKGLEGRVRRIICFRRTSPSPGSKDQLSMTSQDLAALDLHPATLQYATRATTESRFWSTDKSKLSILLCFSGTPKTPCDFLSMTYDVASRSATILIRQSWEPRRHNLDDLDEYDHRLEACSAYWAHPFIMPVVLLQVQFMRCEEAVSDNSSNVTSVEQDVGNVVGFESIETAKNRPKRQLGNSKDGTEKGQRWGPSTMTNLMKKSQEVLKDSIKLLDTIRWMERAVRLLILAGDELSERMGSPSHYNSDLNLNVPRFGDLEREPSPFLAVPSSRRPMQQPPPSKEPGSGDHFENRWHEIRQYLDGLLRLCMGLETDRRMSEARCRAQIDIIYSKMAQEDNVLNARMAVSSSRDSSSMKALAVITAIFLPGEFLGTLFGMSMFDWLAPSEDDEAKSKTTAATAKSPAAEDGDNILSRLFWVYWALAVPLTLFTLLLWRGWWVAQDRYFRQHLSQELSEERFWTVDGKPRHLERGFLYDFFYLSVRRDEKARVVEDESDEDVQASGTKKWTEGLSNGHSGTTNVRQRKILSLRKMSLQQRNTAISV